MKECCRCKKTKHESNFYKRKASKDGLQAYCKLCGKNWTYENKDKIAKHFRTKYYRHKEKVTAQITLRKAVKDGLVLKPPYCEVCGKSFEKDQIHGHHNDYKEPLSVVWCCDRCHKLIHKELDKQKNK